MRYNIRSFPFPRKLPVIAMGDTSYQQHLDGHDHLNPFFLNARPHARNISTQHLATLLDRVVWCCEGACQARATSCNIQKCCNKTLTIFKLDPISSKMHVATFCYRMAKRVKHIVRNNVARCCVCLTGHLKCFNKDFLTSVYSWRNLNRKLKHLIKLFAKPACAKIFTGVSIYLMTRREVKIARYWPSSFSLFYRPNRSRCPQRRKKKKKKKKTIIQAS